MHIDIKDNCAEKCENLHSNITTNQEKLTLQQRRPLMALKVHPELLASHLHAHKTSEHS